MGILGDSWNEYNEDEGDSLFRLNQDDEKEDYYRERGVRNE